MKSSHEHHPQAEGSVNEYAKFILILCGILLVSNVLYLLNENLESIEFVRYLMGTFMVVFASFKLAGYKMFVEMFPIYDLVAKKFPMYAKAYPFIELGLGLLALANLGGDTRDWATLVIMGVGAAGIINTVYPKKKKIHCACLGNIIKLPLSTVSLFEDILMALLASYMLFA